jgi:hypothetical protein
MKMIRLNTGKRNWDEPNKRDRLAVMKTRKLVRTTMADPAKSTKGRLGPDNPNKKASVRYINGG